MEARAGFVCGVDVSERRGLDLAVLSVDGRLIETGWLAGTEELGVWLGVWADRLSVVAVDAPGSTARGSKGRLAEEQLRRRGVALYSVPTDEDGARGWMRTGWRVYELLRRAGLPEARAYGGSGRYAIECYPYAAYVALSGGGRPGGMEAARWARGILRSRGFQLVGTGKDAPDAVAAAVTALAFHLGEAVAYGDPEEGVIWVPGPLPEGLRASGRPIGADGGAADSWVGGEA